MKPSSRAQLPQTRRFFHIVSELRRKCPWDRKQTHRSLIRYLLEEAYETVDAIESGKPEALREELGDLLLQVFLHAEIARQKGQFSLEEVARNVSEKMVRRHPHVFGQQKLGRATDHARNWTKLKSQEKPNRGLLEGTPRALPALQLAQRYGEIAGSVGFDWRSVEQVWKKVEEERAELRRELRRRRPNRSAIAAELGDLFFSLTQLARHLGLDAEAVARASSVKFSDRFERMELEFRAQGRAVTDNSDAQWEAAWNRAKRRPRRPRKVSARTPSRRSSAAGGKSRRAASLPPPGLRGSTRVGRG
jgi:MazG family protein